MKFKINHNNVETRFYSVAFRFKHKESLDKIKLASKKEGVSMSEFCRQACLFCANEILGEKNEKGD